MARKPLSIRLDLENEQQVREALRRLGADGQQAFRQIEQSARAPATPLRALNAGVVGLQGSVSSLLAFAGPLAAMFSAGALVSFTRRSLDAADAIGKTADRLGLTTAALQELRYAAELAGVQQNTLDMALQRFTRRTAEAAEGGGEAKDALAELGVELRDQAGALRPTEELLGEVADAFTRIEDPATRVRLAFKLFDSEGVALVNMLRSGSAGLQEAARSARELGIVMDEELIRGAEDAGDALATMELALTRTGQTAALTFADDVRDAAEAVQDLLRWVKSPDFDDSPMVRFFRFLNEIDSGLGGALAHRAFRRLFGLESADDLRRELDLIEAQIAEAEEQLIEGQVSRSMEGTFRARMDQLLARRSELTRRLLEAESTGPNITITRGLPGSPAPAPGKPAPEAGAGRAARDLAAEAAERQAEKIRGVIDALNFEQAQLTRTAREQAVRSALRRAGIDESHAEAAAVREAAEAHFSLSEASLRLDELMRDGADTAHLFGGAIEDATAGAQGMESAMLGGLSHALTSLRGDFSNLGEVAISVLQHIITELIRMQEVASASGKRGPLSGVFDFFGGLLAGVGGGPTSLLGGGGAVPASMVGRAFSTPTFSTGGGPVLSGMYADGTDWARPGWALVGERGPEIVRFRGGEQVIPNHALRSPGGEVTVRLELSGDLDARVVGTSRAVAVEVVRDATPGIQRGAYDHTYSELDRRRLLARQG